MGCKKLTNKYYESLRTSQLAKIPFPTIAKQRNKGRSNNGIFFQIRLDIKFSWHILVNQDKGIRDGVIMGYFFK